MNQSASKHLPLLLIAAIGVLLILVTGLLMGRKYFLFETYADQGFSVKYPVGWELQEPPYGVAVIFLSPLDNDLDVFRENVNIVVQHLAGQEIDTLEEYTEIAIEQMKRIFQHRIEIIEAKPVRFAGRPGYQLVYIGKEKGDQDMKNLHIWTLDGSVAYQLMYSAQESKYDDYMFQVKQMIRSFKIESTE